MQDGEVCFLTDFARSLKGAAVYSMASTTSPAPSTLLNPLDDLAGGQLLEFFTGVEVMLFIVAIWAIGLRFSCVFGSNQLWCV